MIRFDEALERLLRGARTLGAERVAVDASAGRVLAEDIVAGHDMPAFDHSSMDGYAFAAADFGGSGAVGAAARRGESAAGGALPSFERGTACRIFTGARLPEGSDAIVPQEDVEREGDRVRIKRAPAPGAWVRRRGADLAAGSIAMARGARIMPGARPSRRRSIGRRCSSRGGRW